jgi:restriction system protein
MGKRRRSKKIKSSDIKIIFGIIFFPVTVIILIFYAISKIILIASKKSQSNHITFDSIKDGYQFETYIANLLKKNGFSKVKVTQKSGDYGVDVIAEKGGYRYAFQCKLYSQPVGLKAVQEIYAGKKYYNCHVGVVITNNTFTSSATELAYKTGVLLWDGIKLRSMEKVKVHNNYALR